MGKGIKAGKKPKDPNKIVLNRTELRKLKEEATDEIAIIFSACFMDEYCFDEETGDYYPDTDERIIDLWTRLSRYSRAVKAHDISINRVRKIIEEVSTLEIKKVYR